MLVPAGIIRPCPRSISLFGCRKSTGTDGNSRIASFKTRNTINLTLLLYNGTEGITCEMYLGFVYKENESLIRMYIVRNETYV